MITPEEAGLTQVQYDAIKDGNLPSTHIVIAHRLTPQFESLINLTGTAPFYATVTSTHLVVKDSASTLHRRNLSTGVWDTGTSPFTGTVRLFWGGGLLYAFYIESGTIKRKASSDNGATWGTAETLQAAITDYTIKKIAPVAFDRVHFVAEHNTKKVQHLNMVAWNGVAWVRTLSDVWYPYVIQNMDAIAFNGKDVLFLDTEIPGAWSAENQNLDNTAESYWEQTAALISFTVQNSSDWGYHREIDRAIKMNNPDDFSGIQASVINGQIHLSTWATIGTQHASSQVVKAYVSDDGRYYSLPDVWNLPGATASGCILLSDMLLYYIGTDGRVFVGDATLQFGVDNPALREDISAHIADSGISLSRGTMLAGSITLNNFSGYFDNHPIINRDAMFLLELYVRYFDDGVPIDVYLGKTYFDGMTESSSTDGRYLTLETRDNMRNATDWYRSEDFDQLDGQSSVTILPRASDTESVFAHMATVSGTLVLGVTGPSHYIEGEGDGPHIGLLTFKSDLVNYEFGVGFTSVNSEGNYGFVIHALDNKNYIYVKALAFGGTAGIYYVRDGVETLKEALLLPISYRPGAVKYAAIFTTEPDTTPNHIIDYSDLTATNGKYLAASNTPTSGSFGIRLDDAGISSTSGSIYVEDRAPKLSINDALEWYYAKGRIQANSLISLEAATELVANNASQVLGANYAIGNSGSPSYNNIFDGDMNTYVDYTISSSVTYTLIAETATLSPSRKLNYIEIRINQNTQAWDMQMQYWTGSSWIPVNLSSGTGDDATRQRFWIVNGAAYTKYRFYAKKAAAGGGNLLRVYEIKLHEYETVSGDFEVSNEAKIAVTVDPIKEGPVEVLLTTPGTTHPRYELRVASEKIELNYVNSVGTRSTLGSILYFLNGGDFPHVGDATLQIERELTDTGETHKITLLHGSKRGHILHEITSTFPNGIQVIGADDFYPFAGNTEVAITTLDPGEAPMGGISRAVDGRYIKIFSRFDGTVRVLYPAPQSPSYTFSTEVRNVERSYDIRELYSHVRLLGAYVEGEYVDEALTEIVGHRFIENNNPYLMTESECVTEARRLIRRMKEAADQLSFSAPFNPFLEPEDTVTVGDYGDYIINEISSITFEPGVIRATYSTRRSISE